MCARSVCVLVLCCVTSWAQRHPNFFNRFGNMPENPDFFPQKGFPPFDQFPGPDNPEQPVYPYGTTPKVIIVQAPGFPGMPGDPNEYPHLMTPSFEQTDFENVDTQKPGKVRLAGLPTELKVFPLQLNHSYNELQFNVSWVPSAEFPATGYSIEVASLNKSVYCQSQICFRSDIHENQTWALIPQTFDIVHGGCSIHPGCSYLVKLTAHPSDGKHSTNLKVPLKECEAGVCSCAHREHLPVPVVTAQSFADGSNTTIRWILPAPSRLQRLPLMLGKKSYIIQLGKQSPVPHTPPLFETIPNKRWFNKTKGLVLEGDTERLMPIQISQEIMLRTKLIAAVSLVDERDCVGNPGIATVFDPEEIQRNEQKESKTNLSFGVYAILGALIGAWAMGAVFVLSARVVKRVLKSLRPAPVSAPLEPLRRRPAWFPLQLRTNNEIPTRGQMEESPLYVQKEFEIDEEGVDEWEVSRSRVHLGSLIGSGAFGRVHAAQLDMPGGETITVAAKMLTEDVSEEEVQDFLGEIVMLKHVGSHKHVIRLVACCTRRAPLIALLEHAPRGDLLSLLRAARGRRKESQVSNVTKRVDSSQGRPSEADSEYTNLSDSDPGFSDGDCKLYLDSDKKRDHYVAEPALQLDGSTMREYALQVALGMRHLEERGITHRDLAARNILVDGAGLLKVADFGLSRSGVYVHTRSRPVPLRWLAPEAILHSQYCSASDVWAFAVLLWEIATLGGFPYAELSNHHVPSFLAGGGRLPKPARASPRLYELMVECWSENPSDRPTFSQIVDKLTVQKQLYVDLDCVFPPSEDEVQGLRDYDFNMTEPNGLLDR